MKQEAGSEWAVLLGSGPAQRQAGRAVFASLLTAGSVAAGGDQARLLVDQDITENLALLVSFQVLHSTDILCNFGKFCWFDLAFSY